MSNVLVRINMLKNCITKTGPCSIQRFFFISKTLRFHRKKYFLFSNFNQNIDCEYSLEPPHRGGSNEYLQSMFWIKNKEIRFTPETPSFLYKNGVYRGYLLF